MSEPLLEEEKTVADGKAAVPKQHAAQVLHEPSLCGCC